MDETLVSPCHKPSKVYAQKGARNIPGRVSNTRETLTFVVCVNAAGNEVPPMIIAKGKTSACLSSFNVSQGPPGTKDTWKIYLVSSGLKAISFNSVVLPDPNSSY